MQDLAVVTGADAAVVNAVIGAWLVEQLTGTAITSADTVWARQM